MIKKLSNITLNHTRIEIDGRDSMIRVAGELLHAALSFDERYILLFITDNCQFEETLFIYLLDTQQNKIVDEADIYRMYSPGYFENLNIISDNTVSFEFMVEGVWTLTLYKTPKTAILHLSTVLPFQSVKRPFALSRYFNIKRSKG
ncbi:hypothetical protein [Zophobihabitans entericus]|uniref:Uncharacterized protein n=1 Tax=Zophobihabitans entericus TaxID=1635327 RepID=A0A6G9ID56_9GAMM|nr:hypothetical protein [Zophobihabitans entericus]QIQ22166.1 hypothetical protein IPMB12_11000 [Zophobihabitans entericus]